MFAHGFFGAACKLEEQGGSFLPVTGCRASFVDATHLNVIEDLNSSNTDALADNAGYTRCSSADAVERCYSDVRVCRLRGKTKSCFGHEAEGAFGTDEGAGKIVAGGGFAGSLAGADDGSVSEDNS